MVNLTRIYTKTGDKGTTALGDMSRTSKTDERLAAYADVDETNAALGVVMSACVEDLPQGVADLLRRIQNDLFDVGADLATPVSDKPAKYPPIRITPIYVEELEAACDEHNAELPDLRSFILPGGSPAAAYLHVARTVSRRAERSTWAAIEKYGTEGEGSINPLTAQYLNRLSDLLFILCRVANGADGDVLWQPGGGRLPRPENA